MSASDTVIVEVDRELYSNLASIAEIRNLTEFHERPITVSKLVHSALDAYSEGAAEELERILRQKAEEYWDD